MTKTVYRPTISEIDLDALGYNLKAVKKYVPPSTRIMAVVKANAYGHGIIEVSRRLKKAGVDYLGVASVDEALSIRQAKIKTPILILGSILPGEVKAVFGKDITLTLCTRQLLKAISDVTTKNKRIKVHVKIDTGMGRIGVWHLDAVRFISEASRKKGVELEGIYTHFSSAARDRFFTQYQISSFNNLLKAIGDINIRFPYKHAANSIGVIDFSRSHLNLVRPGLIIYGMYPKQSFKRKITLKPVLSLKSKIVHLKDVPPGRSISYGRTFITERHTKIATIPIGYGDGYGRILSNRAEALVRGIRAPLVGKVTMDQTMLDVGHIKGVRMGDEVVLIGTQGDDKITAEELAKLCSTIPYEIVCSIGARVPRIYNL